MWSIQHRPGLSIACRRGWQSPIAAARAEERVQRASRLAISVGIGQSEESIARLTLIPPPPEISLAAILVAYRTCGNVKLDRGAEDDYPIGRVQSAHDMTRS